MRLESEVTLDSSHDGIEKQNVRVSSAIRAFRFSPFRRAFALHRGKRGGWGTEKGELNEPGGENSFVPIVRGLI